MRTIAVAVAFSFVCAAPLHARIARIVVDETVPFGQGGQLQRDADALIKQAEASAVLKSDAIATR